MQTYEDGNEVNEKECATQSTNNSMFNSDVISSKLQPNKFLFNL